MVKTRILPEVIIAEILEAASAVMLEDSEALDQIIKDLNGRIRTKIHIHHDNSHIKTFRSKIQIPFFSRNLPVSNIRMQTFKIKTLKIKTHNLRIQIFNRNHRLKSLLQILNHMPYTQETQITCHKCGYPNHLATNCTVRKNPPRRGAQKSEFKKLITQHKDQKPKHVKKVQLKKPDTSNEISHIDPPEMCAVLPLEGENLSYVRLKFSSQIKRRALIDTGSCANALPESLFNDINLTNSKSSTLEKPFLNSVRMASGQRVPVDNQAKISFQIGPHYFQDSFLILPTMNSVILGNPFFKKHNITIDPRNNLLQLPDLTVQLNQILPEKGKKRYTKKLPKIPLILTKKVQIAPQSQVLLECSLAKLSDQYQTCTGLVIPSDRLEDKCSIALTSSLSKIDDTGKVFV